MKREKFYTVYEIAPFGEFEHGNTLRGIRKFASEKEAEQFVENTDPGKYEKLTILPTWE